MRLPRLLGLFLVVLAAPAAGQAPDAALQALQGRWVVTGGEHNATPMNSLNGGVMTVSGNAFEIRTASGNTLKGTLRVDSTRQPWQMDFTHADGARWEAIFEIQGDTFRLNYVAIPGKDPRPAAFTTSERTEESIILLRREPK